MKKSEVTPVIIREDRRGYETDLHKINYWLKKHFPKIEKAFAGLDIGSLTNEYLHDIIYNNMAEIKKILTSQAKQDIPSKFLQKEAINRANMLVSKLQDAYEAFDETVQHVGLWSLLEHLSVNENGCISVSDEAKANLFEKHRSYVYTVEGIQRYKAHMKAVKAIQEFVDVMNGEISTSEALDCFDISQDDKIMPVPLTIYE